MKFKHLLIVFILSSMQMNAQTLKLKLWPDGVPGSKPCANYVEKVINPWGSECWEKVSDPELLVFLPEEGKGTGTTVVICPGGGYACVSFGNEGFPVAKWLNSIGITAVILKYRLPSDLIMKDKSIGPLQDAQEAIRIVRRNAKTWNLDAAKVGIMGFSAGGHLAATASTHYDYKVYDAKDQTSARPDFSILVYPVASFQTETTHGGSRQALIGANPQKKQIDFYSNELQVNKKTPPAFLVHSVDDDLVLVDNSILYMKALRKNKVNAELHIFQKGGHGYGLGKPGSTESSWPSLCLQWIKANGF